MRQNTSDPILPTVQYCTVTALGCFCDAAFNGDKGPRTLGAKYAEFSNGIHFDLAQEEMKDTS
jgi:hypothetical protein